LQYNFYLDGVLLPVAPETLEIRTPNRNETIDLLDGREINIKKFPGLKAISFKVLLPNSEYPFANYKGGEYQKAEYYLGIFEKLKTQRKTFQFIVYRKIPTSFTDGTRSIMQLKQEFETNLKVTLEDWNQIEDVEKYGRDVGAEIELLEWDDYSTKYLEVKEDKIVEKEPERSIDEVPVTESVPERKLYTVVSGDTLWGICTRLLGDGSKCWEIAKQNSIANPDLIFPGQVIDLTGV